MNKLLLSKEIYSVEEIEKATQSYGGLAKIRCIVTESYYILTFEDCYYDQVITMKEYENYIIDLMVSKNGK